jgi:hypothetical protein
MKPVFVSAVGNEVVDSIADDRLPADFTRIRLGRRDKVLVEDAPRRQEHPD